jgi:hypothetical protein
VYDRLKSADADNSTDQDYKQEIEEKPAVTAISEYECYIKIYELIYFLCWSSGRAEFGCFC